MRKMGEQPIVTFALAGALSGICSGIIPFIGPMLLPGGLFGLAMLFAICVCIQQLESGRAALLVIGSVIAYFFAIATATAIYRTFEFSTEHSFLEAQMIGSTGGMVGGLIFSLSVYLACEALRQISFIILITFAGSAFGAFAYSVHCYLGLREYLLLVSVFLVWQIGVAATIGAYAKYSGMIPEPNLELNMQSRSSV